MKKHNNYLPAGWFAIACACLFALCGMPALSAQESGTATIQSLDELRSEVLPDLEHLLPGVSITSDADQENVLYIETEKGGPITVSFPHLWNQIQGRTAKAQQREIRAFLASIRDLADGKTFEKYLAAENVLPVIRSQSSVDQIGQENLVCSQLVDEIFVVYVLDAETNMYVLQPADLEKLELDAKQIGETAIRNLRTRFQNYQTDGESDFFRLRANGTCDSSLILLPEVREAMAKKVSGELVFLAPTRDLLIATGDEFEKLPRLRKMVQESFESDAWPISPHALVWRDEQWSILD